MAIPRPPSRGPAAAGPGATATEVAFVGAGKYSDVFKVRAPGFRPVIMKLSYYRDDTLRRYQTHARRGDLRAAAAAKNADSIAVSANFARLTNDLVARGVSPHFVIVYCDVDAKNFAPKLRPLLRERFATMGPVQARYNNLCFMEVMSTNLTKWLVHGRYGDSDLRGVIFQVLYTLAALQALFPGFRHNDLSANNVLVKTLPRPATFSYEFRGQAFAVRTKVLVALSDYDFTHVPGVPGLANERVTNGKYRVDASRNDSYDPHFFLKSVLKCIALRRAKFPETAAFLKRVGLRGDVDRLQGPIPGFSPATLLRDRYFDPLRRRVPEGVADVSSAV